MRLPKFCIRTLMVAVAVAAGFAAPVRSEWGRLTLIISGVTCVSAATAEALA